MRRLLSGMYRQYPLFNVQKVIEPVSTAGILAVSVGKNALEKVIHVICIREFFMDSFCFCLNSTTSLERILFI